jgi:hypothetical protein
MELEEDYKNYQNDKKSKENIIIDNKVEVRKKIDYL